MTIYQVLNEQNRLVNEFADLQIAAEQAELLNAWEEEHYFYVTEVDTEEYR